LTHPDLLPSNHLSLACCGSQNCFGQVHCMGVCGQPGEARVPANMQAHARRSRHAATPKQTLPGWGQQQALARQQDPGGVRAGIKSMPPVISAWYTGGNPDGMHHPGPYCLSRPLLAPPPSPEKKASSTWGAQQHDGLQPPQLCTLPMAANACQSPHLTPADALHTRSEHVTDTPRRHTRSKARPCAAGPMPRSRPRHTWGQLSSR